jgi:hypothetical protein
LTEALFLTLALLFGLGLIWRVSARGLDWLADIFLFFACFFVFYALNYRVLLIKISRAALILTFGMFHWTVPLKNIENIREDELPALWKYGGAGIHFMMVRGRYRVNFNFLEYHRIAVQLKEKKGIVRDVSFTTKRPQVILGIINKALTNQPKPGSGLSGKSMS